MRGRIAKLLGNQGEDLAATFLRRQGFKVLCRQYRSQWGEIDLICRDADAIVFVEVKTRRSEAAGLPFEAVNFRKQRKLTQTALAWLKQKNWLERRARFDVVSILVSDEKAEPMIEHYRNAFEPVGSGQLFS